MYPQSHFLFSLLIALVLANFGIFTYGIAFLIAFASVFVDIDHFIIFAVKRKEWNLKDAWNSEVKRKFKHARTFIHHYLGFVLMTFITTILFFINKNLFWIIGLGYYSHMFLDYTHLNVLKIKERVTIKEFGLIERMDKFELMFDMALLIGIVLVII